MMWHKLSSSLYPTNSSLIYSVRKRVSGVIPNSLASVATTSSNHWLTKDYTFLYFRKVCQRKREMEQIICSAVGSSSKPSRKCADPKCTNFSAQIAKMKENWETFWGGCFLKFAGSNFSVVVLPKVWEDVNMLLLSLDGSWIGTHLASLQPNDASLVVPGMMTPVSIWPLSQTIFHYHPGTINVQGICQCTF